MTKKECRENFVDIALKTANLRLDEPALIIRIP